MKDYRAAMLEAFLALISVTSCTCSDTGFAGDSQDDPGDLAERLEAAEPGDDTQTDIPEEILDTESPADGDVIEDGEDPDEGDPPLYWARTFGRGGHVAGSVSQTSDGGFIAALTSESAKVLMKLDGAGRCVWSASHTGSLLGLYSVQETAGGDYLALSSSEHYLGDTWALKLDGLGEIVWQKVFTAERGEYFFRKARLTPDSGLIMAGSWSSAAGGDALVIRLDAEGAVVWDHVYDGSSIDSAMSVRTTREGGFVVAGESEQAGVRSALVMKLDGQGLIEWQKTFGAGSALDVVECPESAGGGFVVVGFVETGAWVLRLDSGGNILWQKSFGTEIIISSVDHNEEGLVAAGETRSFGAGDYDILVIRLDVAGDTLWQKTYGGPAADEVSAIQLTKDGGHVIHGIASSFDEPGSSKLWVLKTDAWGLISPSCPSGTGMDVVIETAEPSANAADSFLVRSQAPTIELPGDAFSGDHPDCEEQTTQCTGP